MTPAELADLAESMVPVAQRLIGAVHDDGVGEVARVLHEVPATHLPALAVVLAGMCDPDQSAAGALSWVTWDDTMARPPEDDLFTDQPAGAGDELAIDPKFWSDERCATLSAAWRRRERGSSPAPATNPFIERLGHREHVRRRKADRRAQQRRRGDVSTRVSSGA